MSIRLSTTTILFLLAGSLAVLTMHLQVAFQLFRELAIAPVLPEQAPQPHAPRTQASHGVSLAAGRKRDMIAVACSQPRSSLRNCFAPARVSL